MEIRGIQSTQDLQLLLELVQEQLKKVATGENVYGGPEAQMEVLEQLNGIANGLTESIRENERGPASDDFGWKLLD